MCGGVTRSGSQVTFSPDVKCCDYVPHLANFVAGRALAGPGRRSVLDRVERRAGVTTLGLALSHADVGRMVAARSQVGSTERVRCPHFSKEIHGCTIWDTRNAVCATWFCQHERGARGQRFWHAVRDLLMAAEEQVARHCLNDAGLPDDQVTAVLEQRAEMREIVRRANAGQAPPASATGAETPQWYARMWGAWQGREEDWFARCARSAAALQDRDLGTLLAESAHLVQDVRRCWSDLQNSELPLRLRFSPGAGTEATADVLRLVGYSPLDPVILPAAYEPGLWHLDGRPIIDVRAEIQQVHNLDIDLNVLQQLHDFGVVLPPS
jgi:hypothetical protein